MPRWLARTVALLLLTLGSSSGWAQTFSWATLPTISPTTTLSAGHICYTDGTDIACDASAPTLGGVGSSDRIVSGTSGVYVSNTGVITTAISGSTVGYYNAGGLVVSAISTTGVNGVSATNGYFSGKVGIGGTVPSNPTAALQVSGTFIVSNSAQTTTPSIYVDAKGNVGFGTNAPSGTVHIVKNYTSLTSASLQIANLASNYANKPVFMGQGWGGYYDGYGLIGVSNTVLMMLDSATGAYFPKGASAFDNQIFGSYSNAYNAYTPNDGSNNGTLEAVQQLRFRTNYTQRMVINNAGNVGIGITAPAAPLEVSGTISTTMVKFAVASGAPPVGQCAGPADAGRVVQGSDNRLFLCTPR